jgi:signal transduction histidine kinase
LIKEHAYRQQLFNRMINVEESERKKLSTAVHDEMGQGLSALKIYLGLIMQSLRGGRSPTKQSQKEIASPATFGGEARNDTAADEVISRAEQCKNIISGLLEKSHNIAFLLRPPDLDEVGLLESVESLLIESKHLTGVNYTFEKPKEKLDLAPEYSLLIYRLTQELLTNMAKHAQAKNVELRMNRNGNSIELFYRDDGRGFDCEQGAQKLLRRKEDKFSFGLLGLKERVEVLDGVMRVNSASGKGTSITVRFPV